jgi:D-glycero-alpha-D-manno-heptose-7-phosphate kinase
MIVARAPLRIPLGGGGTDLPSYYSQYGGFVLSAAINKYVYISINRPQVDDLIRVKYSKSETVEDLNEVQHELVREAMRLTGVERGVEIVSMADVPAGTGMGSSGSFLIALLRALHAMKREHVAPGQLAEEACRIEIEMVGSPVGKQDPYVAAYGGISCFEIAPSGEVAVNRLPLNNHRLDELRGNLLLFFTGIQRRAMDILEDQKRDTMQSKDEVVKSLHQTKTLGLEIKEALEAGDFNRFGELLDVHWQNKKRRSTKVSDPRIDRWYDIARDRGALGGKLIGAGGGGFFLFYCSNPHKGQLREAMTEEGLREMQFDFDFEGAKVVMDF